MSVNPLLTNYNALGGSVFAPASGGGGGGGGGGAGSIISSINSFVQCTPNEIYAAINAGTNQENRILFNISNSAAGTDILGFSALPTTPDIRLIAGSTSGNIDIIATSAGLPNTKFRLGATLDYSSRGQIIACDATSVLFSTADLTVSSINGAAPAGGGPLLSTFGNMTAESLRLSTGSVTGLSGIELIYFGQNSVGNQGFGIVDPVSNTKVALIGSEFNPTSSKFDTYISCAGPGSSSSGRIEFVNQTFLNAPNANLAISTINGAVPGGGSGATSIALPINTQPTNLADFATTISAATAVAVSANPLITITSLPIGWYSISIPRFLLCPAQSTPGTPAPGTTVPYGTFVSYFLRVGTGATTSDNFLAMFPIVPEGTGVVSSTQSETHLYGTFYNPVATPFDTFTLYTYATTPTGTTGIGNWCQILSSVGGIASYVIITPLPT